MTQVDEWKPKHIEAPSGAFFLADVISGRAS